MDIGCRRPPNHFPYGGMVHRGEPWTYAQLVFVGQADDPNHHVVGQACPSLGTSPVQVKQALFDCEDWKIVSLNLTGGLFFFPSLKCSFCKAGGNVDMND